MDFLMFFFFIRNYDSIYVECTNGLIFPQSNISLIERHDKTRKISKYFYPFAQNGAIYNLYEYSVKTTVLLIKMQIGLTDGIHTITEINKHNIS